MLRSIYLFLNVIALTFILSGCYSKKKILLFQDAKVTKSSDSAVLNNEAIINTLRIQPFDVLDIRIISTDKALSNLTESKATTTGTGSVGGYFTAYHVDSRGVINLPLIGEMVFSNLTISEAKMALKEKLKDFLVDPYVDVKFLTFRVTVLGEIKNPGIITVPNEKASLIDVIALAGDLSEYADRTQIKILRGDPKQPEVYIIDITKYNAFKKQGFILMPNDIVYIQPLTRKFILTNLTTALSFLAVANVANLAINIYRLL